MTRLKVEASAAAPPPRPYQLTHTRMHYRLLVTTRNAASSFDARCHVSLRLAVEGFVIDQNRRWSGGIADWYVIGGRYTGSLVGISDAEWERRDRGAPLGYEDDAQLVTPALYDSLLEPYEPWGSVDTEYIDLEGEPVTRDFINLKWILVVDYHV